MFKVGDIIKPINTPSSNFSDLFQMGIIIDVYKEYADEFSVYWFDIREVILDALVTDNYFKVVC